MGGKINWENILQAYNETIQAGVLSLTHPVAPRNLKYCRTTPDAAYLKF